MTEVRKAKLNLIKYTGLLAAVMCAAVTLVGRRACAEDTTGLYVEPGVTLELGSSTIDWPSPFQNSTGTVNGLGINAKVGFHFTDLIFAGADLRYARPQFKDSSNNLDAAATEYNYGVLAGVQMPVVGLRVWAGYIFGGQLDPESSNNVDMKFKDGKGYRVGAGFHLLMVSLNLEYQSLKYDTTEIEALGPFTTGTNFGNAKLTDNAWIASVSFPIEL